MLKQRCARGRCEKFPSSQHAKTCTVKKGLLSLHDKALYIKSYQQVCKFNFNTKRHWTDCICHGYNFPVKYLIRCLIRCQKSRTVMKRTLVNITSATIYYITPAKLQCFRMTLVADWFNFGVKGRICNFNSIYLGNVNFNFEMPERKKNGQMRKYDWILIGQFLIYQGYIEVANMHCIPMRSLNTFSRAAGMTTLCCVLRARNVERHWWWQRL